MSDARTHARTDTKFKKFTSKTKNIETRNLDFKYQDQAIQDKYEKRQDHKTARSGMETCL